MIPELTREVGAYVNARRRVAVVSYGAPALDEGIPSDATVTVRELGDVYDPAGTSRQPVGPGCMWCFTACIATFRVASGVAGATEVNHVRRCRDLVDAFVLGLRARAHARRSMLRSVSGDFVQQGDGSQPHGVRYDLRFEVGRVVELNADPLLDGSLVNGTDLELETAGRTTMVVGGLSADVCAPAAQEET